MKRLLKKRRILLGRFLVSYGFSEYTILVIFSIITGAGAGIAAVGFHSLIEFLNNFFFIESHPFFSLPVIIMMIPPFGMLIQYLMIHLAPKQARQKGVLQVIKAVELTQGDIPIKTTLFHFLAPAMCMGTGGTVGPEGPAAQIGAGVSSAIGTLFGLGESHRRIFTAAGAGAAIAAVFNTPMGGVFFALEVILLNDFRPAALISFLIASVVASTISRSVLGNDPNFVFGTLELVSIKYYFFYLLLGILAGFISVAFLFFDDLIKNQFKHIYRYIPQWSGMVLVGLVLGASGIVFPQLLGIGYGTINAILAGKILPPVVVILLLLKFLLVPAVLHSGGFGGVFAPSLFIGACAGYLFTIVVNLLPGLSFNPTTFILVGMGAVLAGINSIPIAGILIIFEMTNNYDFILPLMLGVGSCTIIVQMVLKSSIYIRKLNQQGFRYSMGRESRILRSLLVKDVMTRDIILVPENMPLPLLVQQCVANPHQKLYTVNKNGKTNGVISTSNLNTIITDYHDLTHMVIARDIADSDLFFVNDTENLERVMQLFAVKRMEEFPVVTVKHPGQVMGLIRQQDVIDAYNQAIVKFNLSHGLAEELKLIEKEKVHQVMPGFAIAAIPVPKAFIGKNIAELRIRNRFHIEILMIERPATLFDQHQDEGEKLLPNLTYRFETGDQLIIFGNKENVMNFMAFSSKN